MPIRLDLFYKQNTTTRIIKPRRRPVVNQYVFLLPVATNKDTVAIGSGGRLDQHLTVVSTTLQLVGLELSEVSTKSIYLLF